MPGNQLIRKPESGLLGGVCAGLAEYLGWKASTTRLVYVLISVLSAAFPGILVYIILWLFMPKR